MCFKIWIYKFAGDVEGLIPGLTSGVSSTLSTAYTYPLLNPSDSKCWRPVSNTSFSEYIELRIPSASKYYVTSIETRGGVTVPLYVTQYALQFYDDTLQNWVWLQSCTALIIFQSWLAMIKPYLKIWDAIKIKVLW